MGFMRFIYIEKFCLGRRDALPYSLVLAVVFFSTAALAAPAPAGPPPPEPVAEAVVLERGPFYKIIQTPTGGQYQEMADGLCYQDPQDGIWKDSVGLIGI